MKQNIYTKGIIYFLWEAKNCNPNGQAIEGNPPKISKVDDKDYALATAECIKRRIRNRMDQEDVWLKMPEQYDMVPRKEDLKGNPLDFEDVRAFGVLSPIEKKKKTKDKKGKKGGVIARHGPIQFQLGESIHPVKKIKLNQSSKFASKETSQTGGSLFQKEYVRYAAINNTGTIDRNNGDIKEETIKKILDGLKKTVLESSSKHICPLAIIFAPMKGDKWCGDRSELLEINKEIRNRKELLANIDFKPLFENLKQYSLEIRVFCDDEVKKIIKDSGVEVETFC